MKMTSKPESGRWAAAGVFGVLLVLACIAVLPHADDQTTPPATEAAQPHTPALEAATAAAPEATTAAAPEATTAAAPEAVAQDAEATDIPEPSPDAEVAQSPAPATPADAPQTTATGSTDLLSIAREQWLQGDARGVVSTLSPWLDTRTRPYGRTRHAGHLLLGLAHMELENWRLASRNFYKVRRSTGPLAPYGAWYEAKADHLRGRHHVAIRECRDYRSRYEDGTHADECLLLIGHAHAAAGQRFSSVASYSDYLDKHPDTPRTEEIQLAKTLAYVASAPKQAIRMLHELALSHSYPSTDLAVQAALVRLSEQGHEVAPPDDPTSRTRRAEALRRSGQHEAAWALFEELSAAGDEDKRLQTWTEDNVERFAWGTREYEVYAKVLTAQYDAEPSADLAWKIFRAWSRDGRYDKAVEWGRRGLEKHASHHRWRAAYDDMAWATLHAGLYEESAERWMGLTKRGGAFGRKARFYAAFSSLQHGDWETAIAGFDKLLKRPGEEESRALYWRAKARAASGDEEGAQADYLAAASADLTGWYTMVRQPRAPVTGKAWRIRDGRWHGPPPLIPPTWEEVFFLGRRPSAEEPEEKTALQSALPAWAAREGAWAAHTRSVIEEAVRSATLQHFKWSDTQLAPAAPTLPDGYLPSRYWDAAQAQKQSQRFAESNKEVWPDLPAAHDLARIGEYADAARIVHAAYAEWLKAWNNPKASDARLVAIRELSINKASWRPLLLFVRDHYHAARATHGLHKSAEDDAERNANLRLAYPVVAAGEIWRHSQEFNVDPYLVMGIMRQESSYRNTALSRVGAIGLIQVMPSTGARVAAMMGEQTYSPLDLEDPSTNLRYGTFYLSKLLDRFDGVFPLAVASYNGGPHNVSRWYERHQGEIDLDAYVEQIEYDETRDYVKRVSGHYSRYVSIYEGDDAQVALPATPRGDDATVINF